jgi:hypothetical protein
MCLSIAAPLNGEWHRVVLAGTRNFDDIPAAHTLAYFTQHPFLRDDGNSLCIDCGSAVGKASSMSRYKVNIKVRHIGTLSGLTIIEVDYTFTDNEDDAPVSHWISLLVRAAPETYREIYHLQADAIALPLEPARIVHVNGGDVLMTNNSDGGNGGGCYEGYWSITSAGNTKIDFSPLHNAISEHIPGNATFTSSCWALHLDRSELTSWVQKRDAACHACGGLGEVTAHFKLNGTRAEATQILFRSDPE